MFSYCLPVFTQTSTTINVHIVDENDNAPEFPEEEYVTVLSEGPDTVGATIATVTAIDPDEGLNGTLRYAIAQGNLIQTFRINSITVSCHIISNCKKNNNNNKSSASLCVYDVRLCLGEDYCSKRAGLRDQQRTLRTGCHRYRPVPKSCSSLDIQHNSNHANKTHSFLHFLNKKITYCS